MHDGSPSTLSRNSRSIRLRVVSCILGAAFTAGEARASNGNPLLVGGPGHPMPLGHSRLAPGPIHLGYFGGRVVTSPQVVVVLWGTGNYLSNVSSTSSPSMATFYQGVLNSPYVDWLAEYDTDLAGGTRQFIGRGGFVTQITITPSVSATTVDDTQIQAELAVQIQAGHLPAPMTDAAGNTSTYYAIFFPPGITITLGSDASCSVFCAYHGTIPNVGGHEVYYGIHPDMQAPSGCATGCGNGATPFDNYTTVASHELVETMTDPEVGLAAVIGPPLAWYDAVNGEIGDICNASQGSIVGGDNVTYTVQKQWSNSVASCIVQPSNDYTVTLSPGTVNVPVGGSTSLTVTTTGRQGTAETLTLSVTNLPSGVTGTFSPATLTAGGTSSLNLTAASNAAASSAKTFVVKAVAPSATHTASASAAVVAAKNDFSISIGPSSATVAAGSSSPFAVTTLVTSGAAQSLALTVSGLPKGVTGSFNPATISAGGSSTLTLSAAANAPGAAATPFTVTGTGASATHTATASAAVTPAPNDFAIGVSPASATVAAGGSQPFSITTQVTSGVAQSITLSISGLPSGVTGSFNPATITAGASSTLTLSAAANAPGATATTFTVTGTGAAATHAATASVAVTLAPNDFAVSVSPSSATLAAGGSQPFSVTTQVTSGVAQSITLSISGLPSGVTGSFNPATISAGSSSTLTLSAAANAPGTAATTFSVTGTAASAAHSATASLAVTPAPNDFAIHLSPGSATMTAGGAQPYTVSTLVTSGVAQTITLSVSGLPSGVTGSFNPATINAGASSTLTLTSTANAPAASATTFTVTATGTFATHAATASIAVNAASQSVVVNGGFETANFLGWSRSGSTSITAFGPHSGLFAARVGSVTRAHQSTISQTFTLPSGGTGTQTRLSFWYDLTCNDTHGRGYLMATLQDQKTHRTTTLVPKTCTRGLGWQLMDVDVTESAGHRVTLQITDQDDNRTGTPTYVLLDDVATAQSAVTKVSRAGGEQHR